MRRRAPLLGLAALVAIGCARATTPPVAVQRGADFPEITAKLRKVAVLPAEFSKTAQRTESERDDEEDDVETGVTPARRPSDEGAKEVVTSIVLNAVARETSWTVVDPERVAAALDAIDERAPLATRAGRVAEIVGADAALGVRVERFREREGSDYGVKTPASVALRLVLVRSGARDPAWTADYAHTQQPLTYNLWNFWGVLRGGPKWMRAAELARIGIDEAIGRLSGRRAEASL